jgi:hypothetical protein
MARDEEWSVGVRMPDSAAAESLVSRYAEAGRDAARWGRRVSIYASGQDDAQALAAEIEAAHPGIRVVVRGD